MKEKIAAYVTALGDNSLLIGHRLSELCGHGPNLETDIALTNISLDLFGEVRNYFQYAAKMLGGEMTEDKLAFKRVVGEYKNALLVEQPNEDFAHVIVRQFLFDAFHLPLLTELCESNDAQIAAIANKSIKESKYHLRFSSAWMIRLGDGTAESHAKMQAALDLLWAYVDELFTKTDLEVEMEELGIGADLDTVSHAFRAKVDEVIKESTLKLPDYTWSHKGGKQGVHSEHMGFILSDLQYMQRTYPEAKW